MAVADGADDVVDQAGYLAGCVDSAAHTGVRGSICSGIGVGRRVGCGGGYGVEKRFSVGRRAGSCIFDKRNANGGLKDVSKDLAIRR